MFLNVSIPWKNNLTDKSTNINCLLYWASTTPQVWDRNDDHVLQYDFRMLIWEQIEHQTVGTSDMVNVTN